MVLKIAGVVAQKQCGIFRFPGIQVLEFLWTHETQSSDPMDPPEPKGQGIAHKSKDINL